MNMADALIIAGTMLVIEILCGAPRIKEAISYVRQKK